MSTIRQRSEVSPSRYERGKELTYQEESIRYIEGCNECNLTGTSSKCRRSVGKVGSDAENVETDLRGKLTPMATLFSSTEPKVLVSRRQSP